MSHTGTPQQHKHNHSQRKKKKKRTLVGDLQRATTTKRKTARTQRREGEKGEKKKNLGLLTRLGQSIVRNHPGVKILHLFLFLLFFFFLRPYPIGYSPYRIPNVSELYRSKKNDFLLIDTLRVRSYRYPTRIRIRIGYRIFAVSVHQCLFDCREFISEYISVCFLTMLNFLHSTPCTIFLANISLESVFQLLARRLIFSGVSSTLPPNQHHLFIPSYRLHILLPQFGFLPYPHFYPPSSSLPTPPPPPQASNPSLPKLPNLVPAPLTTPNIPTIVTSHKIPSTNDSSGHEGSKRSFLQ